MKEQGWCRARLPQGPDWPPFRSTFHRGQYGITPIISEFYQLRRSAIKDISSYLGFLVGFIGSAPFAWGLLAVQLDAGRFARGLWYFFGIVTTAGIFAGIAGLGIGVAAGLVWEQVHRHRRSERKLPVGPNETPGAPASPQGSADGAAGGPRLQLIAPAPAPLPNLAGRKISAVRFTEDAVEIDFGGHRARTSDAVVVVPGGTRYVYPESGCHNALCGLIGSRVAGLRPLSSGRLEISLDIGSSLIIPRAAAAVSPEYRRVNES